MAGNVADNLDALVKIARDNAAQPETERIAAIRQALPTGGIDKLATAAKARFDAITQTGKSSPDLEAALVALADVYSAILLRADEDTTTDAATGDTGETSDHAGNEPANGPNTNTREEPVEGDAAAGGAILPGDTATPTDTTTSSEPAIASGNYAVMQTGRLRNVPLDEFPTDPVTGQRATAKFSALAAGDTADITAGTPFKSMLDIADVTLDKLRGLSDGGGGYTRSGIATWQALDKPDLYPGMSALEAGDVLDVKTDPAKLKFNSDTMTFGQGWCRPSDVLLDLCPPAARDGMWDVPSVTITGGGIRYPRDADFASIYSSTGWCYTEADEIARTEDKPCFTVPCPEFDEVRLDFCGLCIEASTLVDLAYPQLVASYVAKSLAAFEHLLNARLLAGAWAQSTPADFTTGAATGTPGFIATVLNTIAMQASYLRYRHRLAQRRVLEVVMPGFVLDMIQADAALRGGVNMVETTIAEINRWFAIRNLRPQWVYDFDDAYADADTGKWGGSQPPKAWPATANILIYPAGTFAVARRPMVRVSGVRNDPQLLRQNVFLALFLETAYAVISRCPEAIGLTIPVCVSGEAMLATSRYTQTCTPHAVLEGVTTEA